MGRFYSTNTPQNVDFVYKPPFEIMAKAIQNADLANDEIYDQAKLFNDDIVKVNFLEKDRELVAQKQKQYQDEISGVTTEISDPRNWRKALPKVRDIGRRLQTDLSTGGFGAVQKNYQKLADWEKSQAAGLASGKINQSDYNIAKQHFIDQYGGAINPQTGQPVELQTEGLVHTPDIEGKIAKAVEGMKANMYKKRWDDIGRQWIWGKSNSTEELSETKLAEAAQYQVGNDPELLNYFQQGQRLGFVKDALDEEGKIKPAFKSIKYATKPGEQDVIEWNPDSPLYGAIRGKAGGLSYRRTEEEREARVNQYGLLGEQLAGQERIARARAAAGAGKNPDGSDMIDAHRLIRDSFTRAKPSTIYGVGSNIKLASMANLDENLRKAIMGNLPEQLGEKRQVDYEDPVTGQLGKKTITVYPEMNISEERIDATPVPRIQSGPNKGRIDTEHMNDNTVYSENGEYLKWSKDGNHTPVYPDFSVYDKEGKLVTKVSRDAINVEFNRMNSSLKTGVQSELSEEQQR